MNARSLSLCTSRHACIARTTTRRPAVRVMAFQVTWQSPDGAKQTSELEASKSLLEGALAAGVETPNLCGTGACGSCAAKLLSGSIERSDILLDEAQRDAGYLLLCSAHATSDIEVLMQQETQMHTLPYGL